MISNRMIIKGKKVIVEDGQQLTPGYVVIEGDNISEVYSSLPDSFLSEEIIEADIVSPGFVDIHTHGLGGANEQLEYWIHDYSFKKLPSYGCTSVLASITFPEDLSTSKKVIEILKKRVGQIIEGQTVLEGLHAEGPVVIDCGGLPHAHGETMSQEEFLSLLSLMGPALKIMTIAPSAEAKFQYSRLKALLDHGAVPALGHDKEAVEKDIIGALRVCASHNPPVVPHMTHMCNVSSFHHRIPSLVNFGMVDHYPNEEQYKGIPVPTIEMIGDLVHVSALTLKAVLGNRSPNHLAFVTDSVLDSDASSSLCSDKKMAIKEVYMGRKAVVMEGTDTIAGSCGNMIQILQSLVNVLQVPVGKAVQMLSETPATIARINSHVGTLSAGKRADVLLLDSNLKLMSTIIAGKVAYKQQVLPK